jgi:hypothetical protein
VCTEFNNHDDPHLVFGMDVTRYAVNNVAPKLVTTKAVRDVFKYSAERGENVTCCML